MTSGHSTSNPNRTFPHRMLEEIYQQPQTLRDTLAFYVQRDTESRVALNPAVFAATRTALLGHDRAVIAASGSSRHAGLAAEILLEDLAGLSVDVEYASEYVYRSRHTLQDPCAIVVSQSGETADTLFALREAKSRGLPTIAITNNPDSTMAREASASLPVQAGKERAIPATKSFTGQLAVFYLLACFAGRLRGRMTPSVAQRYAEKLGHLADQIESFLPQWEAQIAAIAKSFSDVDTFLYLGRGIHYAIAREGALKLKESAYLQAEGYPAGELKHGPRALLSERAAMVVLSTCDNEDPDSVLRYTKTLALLKELHDGDTRVIAIASEGDAEVPRQADHCIFVPDTTEYLTPICEVVPLQLLAYSLSVALGIDVDNPRNLTKAVIQE